MFRILEVEPFVEELPWTERLRQDVSWAAAVLDEHFPGWEDGITRPLEMRSCHGCVLAQVFGDFARGLSALFERCGEGFVRRTYSTGVFALTESTPFWVSEIARRRMT